MCYFDYVILPEVRCIVQRFTGMVTLGDVMEASARMWEDPMYDRHYDVLSDLRGAETSAVPRDVYDLLAFLRRPEVSVGRCAAIFADRKGTALAYFFRAASALNSQMEVFSTWEGAAEYLGVKVKPAIIPRRA